MRRFSGSVDMTGVAGSLAERVQVVQDATGALQCSAELPTRKLSVPVGTVKLTPGDSLAVEFDPHGMLLVGGQIRYFLSSLRVLLWQRGIVTRPEASLGRPVAGHRAAGPAGATSARWSGC